jgi:hypothetical protein
MPACATDRRRAVPVKSSYRRVRDIDGSADLAASIIVHLGHLHIEYGDTVRIARSGFTLQ